MPGWYAAFAFLLLFGLSLARSINIAASSAPEFYSQDYLRALVVGKSQTDVIDILGKPYLQKRDPLHNRRYYVYRFIVRDVRTNAFAPEVHIYFAKHPSGSFVVQELKTVWISGADKAVAFAGSN